MTAATKYNLRELRAAAATRDDPLEPEGHVCMTGDYALALLDAVEAACVLMSSLFYSDHEPLDAEAPLRAALARFDFGGADV